MAVPAFSYSVALNTNLSTPTVVVTDTTNYGGFDVTLMLAVVTEAISPASPFYTNSDFGSPDFDGNTSQLTWTHNLPLNGSGNVPLGLYTFVITPQYNGVNQTPVTVTVNLQLTLPKPNLNISFDCFQGVAIFSDETVLTDVQGGTLIANSVVRSATIKYPINQQNPNYVSPNPITTNLQVLTIGNNTAYQLWSGAYQYGMEITATYLLNDGITQVTVTIVGNTGETVTCDSSICCLRQCIDMLSAKWMQAKNAVDKAYYQDQFLQVLAYLASYQNAMQCRDTNTMSASIEAIKLILGNTNCTCCPPTTGAPIQILPLTPNSFTNISIAAGTYISVNYSGGIWTISVNNTLQNIITTIQGDITTINTTLISLQNQINAIVSSKYIKEYVNDASVTSGLIGVQTLVKTWTTPLLTNNNDEIIVTTEFINTPNAGVYDSPTLELNFNINATITHFILPFGILPPNMVGVEYWMKIIRISNLLIRYELFVKIQYKGAAIAEYPIYNTQIACSDLNANTITINALAKSISATFDHSVTNTQFKVELLKA